MGKAGEGSRFYLISFPLAGGAVVATMWLMGATEILTETGLLVMKYSDGHLVSICDFFFVTMPAELLNFYCDVTCEMAIAQTF